MINPFANHHQHDYKIDKNNSVNHHKARLEQFKETKQKQLERLK